MNITPVPRDQIAKVSIGMPVYNGEHLIHEALDSLLAQTFTDFELIISDNASTDATPEICEEYAAKDSRIRYFRQVENIMIRNGMFVLEQAKGEYFMWAAHDDVWHPEFLISCVQNLEQHKECDLAFCTYALCAISGDIVHIMPDYTRFVNKWRVLTVCRYIFEPDILGKVCLFYGLYRTNICKSILNVRPLDFEKYWGCDNHFILALLSRHNLAVDKRVLFHKRDKLKADQLIKIYELVTKHPHRYMLVPFNQLLNYLEGQLSAVKGTPYFWAGFLTGVVRLFVSIVYKLPATLNWVRRKVVHYLKMRFV